MLDAHLQRFYAVLRQCTDGGLRHLAASHGRLEWPQRGVYFFFEDGELRIDGSNWLSGFALPARLWLDVPVQQRLQ